MKLITYAIFGSPCVTNRWEIDCSCYVIYYPIYVNTSLQSNCICGSTEIHIYGGTEIADLPNVSKDKNG